MDSALVQPCTDVCVEVPWFMIDDVKAIVTEAATATMTICDVFRCVAAEVVTAAAAFLHNKAQTSVSAQRLTKHDSSK